MDFPPLQSNFELVSVSEIQWTFTEFLLILKDSLIQI